MQSVLTLTSSVLRNTQTHLTVSQAHAYPPDRAFFLGPTARENATFMWRTHSVQEHCVYLTHKVYNNKKVGSCAYFND